MTNPYHDETGRFCSKGEMGAAVQRLVASGDTNTAFTLLSELKDIENGQAPQLAKPVVAPAKKADAATAWQKKVDESLVNRRVRSGANPDQSKKLLAELYAAHDGDNLASALTYNGFATPARAQKIAEEKLRLEQATKKPVGESVNDMLNRVARQPEPSDVNGSWGRVNAGEPKVAGSSGIELQSNQNQEKKAAFEAREELLASQWEEKFGPDESADKVAWNGTGVGRTRKFFADDDVLDLREKAKSSSNEAEIRELAKSKDKILVIGLGTNTNAPADLLTKLAGHKSWGVRRAVAKNPSTPKAVRESLRNDPEKMVRNSVI